ncbi:hypothetical protein Mycch_2911 [Mycolicibacterium chubuense NBB4]|uniref:Uncharacterized protein n=1 Tax=Mycolicibacterium chubuense (strain NBB4) TaxID=710421 RepID=I4BK64_MYCCN|nr:hypothetical protein [Mycolicibacterium chubuense]AFM17671.1 hypothetical protein Mycch_2911 [Mycolicibacterium chubuense NBB4]
MSTTTRSYVTAGVALVGASIISATPITTLQPEFRSASYDVDLVAATQTCGAGSSSALCGTPTAATAPQTFGTAGSTNVLNIPANLAIALANTPYNLLNALGEGNVALGSQPDGGFSFQPTYDGVSLTQHDVVGLGAALSYGGSWWLYSPTNILGTDAADPGKYEALTNVLVPFPALSVPLGNMFAAIAASQLPMDTGCTGTGPGACDHPEAILGKSMDFRNIAALFSPEGYTFPETRGGITCNSTGQCYVKDVNGAEVPWSGQTVKLDPTTPFTSFYDSLTGTPDVSQIKPVTPQLLTSTFTSLSHGAATAFNPFVLGTQCPLCAAFVPNPENKPVPGPVFTDPNAPATTETTTPAATDASVKQVAAPSTTTDQADSTTAPAPQADTPKADSSPSDTATTTGPKHRKPSTLSDSVSRVRDSINTGVGKISGGFTNKSDSASSDSPTRSSSTTSSGSDSGSKKSGGSGSGGSD